MSSFLCGCAIRARRYTRCPLARAEKSSVKRLDRLICSGGRSPSRGHGGVLKRQSHLIMRRPIARQSSPSDEEPRGSRSGQPGLPRPKSLCRYRLREDQPVSVKALKTPIFPPKTPPKTVRAETDAHRRPSTPLTLQYCREPWICLRKCASAIADESFPDRPCVAVLGTSWLAAITAIKCHLVKSPPRAARQRWTRG